MFTLSTLKFLLPHLKCSILYVILYATKHYKNNQEILSVDVAKNKSAK